MKAIAVLLISALAIQAACAATNTTKTAPATKVSPKPSSQAIPAPKASPKVTTKPTLTASPKAVPKPVSSPVATPNPSPVVTPTPTASKMAGVEDKLATAADDAKAKVTAVVNKVADTKSSIASLTTDVVSSIKDVENAKTTAVKNVVSALTHPTVSIDGTCSGIPACVPKLTAPIYGEPEYDCPKDYTLGVNDGRTQCIQTNATCPTGTNYINGDCCSPCPAGCTAQGNLCYSAPQQTCYVSKSKCPADCESTSLCQKTLFGHDCSFQCCKTVNPVFPATCTPATVDKVYCDPIILCPKGALLDKNSYKCLLDQGSVQSCPKSGVTCDCGLGNTLCASSKKYFGVDACKLFCASWSDLKLATCAA